MWFYLIFLHFQALLKVIIIEEWPCWPLPTEPGWEDGPQRCEGCRPGRAEAEASRARCASKVINTTTKSQYKLLESNETFSFQL